jgi:hypothetical protein
MPVAFPPPHTHKGGYRLFHTHGIFIIFFPSMKFRIKIPSPLQIWRNLSMEY